MNPRGLVVTCILVLGLLTQPVLAAAQNSQSQSAEQSSNAGVQKAASGEKTVTGCVAREGEGFVLKTDEGTYEFDTARDLTPYVGKKVTISGRWKATGVTTTAPIKSTGAAAEAPASTKKAEPANSFVGDLHLHITGTVVGDCAPANK